MFCTFLLIESFPLLHTYLLSSYYHTPLCSVFFTLLWPRQIHIIIHTTFFIGTTILFLSAYCKYIVFTINSTIVLALQYALYVFFRFLCFFLLRSFFFVLIEKSLIFSICRHMEMCVYCTHALLSYELDYSNASFQFSRIVSTIKLKLVKLMRTNESFERWKKMWWKNKCVCIKKFFDDSKLVEFKAAAQNNLWIR